MNKFDATEREARLQAAAEQAERNDLPVGDAELDAYRLVIRAVREAAMPGLPEDFARRVSVRISPTADQASFEDGMVTLLLLGMALGGGGYFLPRFWPLLASLPLRLPTMNLPAVSWHWIVAAGLAISLAWLIDRFWHEHHGAMPA